MRRTRGDIPRRRRRTLALLDFFFEALFAFAFEDFLAELDFLFAGVA
jgi:hypothetical protein